MNDLHVIYGLNDIWPCIIFYISGWEYTTDGKCEKMPSTRLLNVKIRSLPCLEQEGMIWIWPGDDPPTPTLPSLQPPSGFVIHAEVHFRCFKTLL